MLDETYEKMTDKEKVRYWEAMYPFYKGQGKRLERYRGKLEASRKEKAKLKRDIASLERAFFAVQERLDRPRKKAQKHIETDIDRVSKIKAKGK